MADVITERAPGSSTPAPPPGPPARRSTDHGPASSPEALDTVAGTTTTRAWIALAAIAAVVIAALIWAFVGSIPQQIGTTGVLTDANDTYTVVAGRAGSVVVSVTPGSEVAAGAKVATVTPFGAEGDVAAGVDVTTPNAGRVQDVLVRPGVGVEPANPLVTIVPDQSASVDDHVVTYLSASDAADFHIGRQVDVTLVNPATSAPLGMQATVVAVAEAPSTPQAIAATLRSDRLADRVLDEAGGAAYRVDLRIEGLDELDAAERPTPGQVVTISNTYARPRPIDLLFGTGS